jgi:hypothetical protein
VNANGPVSPSPFPIPQCPHFFDEQRSGTVWEHSLYIYIYIYMFLNTRHLPTQVCNYKLDAHAYLLGLWLDGLDIAPDCKAKIREVMKTISSCRSNVSPYGDEPMDLTFQVNWKDSSKLTLQFIEDCLYTNVFDARYRDAKKSGLEVVDFLNYPSVSERITDIHTAIAAEKPPPVAKPSEAAAPSNADGSAAVTNADTTDDNSAFGILSQTEQDFFDKLMVKTIKSSSKLLVDDGSTSQLIAQIRGSPLALTRGENTGS